MLVLMAICAFQRPVGVKPVKRRIELIKERHGDVIAGQAQAQIRKLIAQRASRVEGFASSLIPKPALLRKRLEMTGENITLAKYSRFALGIAAFVIGALMLRGAPFLLALFVGLFVGVGLPHFVVGKMIKRRVAKFTVQLPRRHRPDGPRPSLGPADHRNAGHRRDRRSPARSGSSSARSPTR